MYMFRQLLTAAALLLAAGLANAGEAARIVFVAGKVEVAGAQLALGGAVQEGADIVTGPDGYVYLKTIDDGFLILRPNSRARIVAYHIDPKQPANTRIKLELASGVARAISGEGAKQAKQNFRFNTPVAAIGVRGTDFTVYTDQETSRVAVISGGVVVSGFTGSCGPEGSGPCEGSTSRELFARQSGQVLQVTKGQAAPQFMPASSNSPDMVAPPRGDEPANKTSSVTVGTPLAASLDLDPQKTATLQNAVQAQPQPVQPEAPRTIHWGRWQTVLDQAANIDISKLRGEGARLIALGDQLALLRTQAGEWQIPNTGVLNFGLRESAAYINEEGRGLYTAKVENGRLQVDFGKQSFTTGFDLVNQTERFKLQAEGGVTKDGLLLGNSQLLAPTNMAVNGVVSPDGTAGYLFQSRIDATRVATGATYWAK
jgi:hypothetical protein